MKRHYRTLAGLTGAVMLATTAVSAFAQGPTTRPPSTEAWKAHAQDRGRAKAHALHDLLNIHPDQEAAFQAFIASSRKERGEDGEGPPGAREHAPGDLEHLTTPERLDRLAARMAKEQAAFQAHIDAVKRFYAVLSPEQQRAFDALPRLGFGGGGHWAGPGDRWDHPGPGDHEPKGPMAPPPPPAE